MEGPWLSIGSGNDRNASIVHRRIKARLIDLLITGLVALLVLEVVIGVILQEQFGLGASIVVFALMPIVWTLLVFTSDFVGIARFGTTVGKRVVGLRVERFEPVGAVGWSRALIRTRAQPLVFLGTLWVPLLLASIYWFVLLVGAWFAWMVSHLHLIVTSRPLDGRGRRDRIAGTAVRSG